MCVDASVIPSALGVNPLATITALAERSVEHVAAKRGIKIDYETKNGILDLFGPPGRSLFLNSELQYATQTIEDQQRNNALGTAFSEVMEGYIYAGDDIEDFSVAAEVAHGGSSSARFFLSVHAWDTMQRRSVSLISTRMLLTHNPRSCPKNRPPSHDYWNLLVWCTEQRSFPGVEGEVPTLQ